MLFFLSKNLVHITKLSMFLRVACTTVVHKKCHKYVLKKCPGCKKEIEVCFEHIVLNIIFPSTLFFLKHNFVVCKINSIWEQTHKVNC